MHILIVGNLVRAAENALKLEARRIQTYKELEDRNQSIISSSNMVMLYPWESLTAESQFLFVVHILVRVLCPLYVKVNEVA